MAEGGVEDIPTEKTHLIPKTGDDDDDGDKTDWDNIDLSQIPATEETTLGDTDSAQNSFKPDAASTPSGGESINMPTRTRLPKSAGLASQKPLLVSQQHARHGVRLKRSL